MYSKLKNAYFRENFALNIYNEPLQKCPDRATDTNGSWMQDKTCSEMGGGVHQICYRNIGTNANKFSKNTGQPDWSTKRGSQNHCVCLGAWALYKKKIDDNKITSDGSSSRLKCNAIPNTVFDNGYVDSFSKWNNLEESLQIVNGVEGIVHECYRKAKKESQKKALAENYCTLAKKIPALQSKRPMYDSLCLQK